jgi:hypothetical protein
MKKSLLLLLFLFLVQICAYSQTNVALGKRTSCSDSTGVAPGITHYSPLANDADGTNASYWEAPAPAWWKVDLDGIYNLTSVVIRTFYVAGFTYHFTYNIEVSTDDVTYTQVAAKTNSDPTTDAGDTYNITATARYIRVNMITSDGPNVQISDFRAYGLQSTPTYTIVPTAGIGGTITPNKTLVLVDHNANQTFTITPNLGFKITDVLVDGVSVGAVSSYTFSNVTANHTIAASFETPVSLALNKPSTSENNTFNHGAALGNDADGSNLSYWEGTLPAWWKVDLGSVYDITTIIIRNFYVAGFTYEFTYSIEVSSDDVTYAPLAAKSNSDPTTDAGDMYNVTATGRYLRVNMLTNPFGPNGQISDFKVYGKFPLTISGVTAANKAYDGTNTAALSTGSASLVGIFGGDVVTLVSTGAAGTFADKNVAAGKVVSTTGFTLGGASASRYTLTQPTTTADITAVPVTVTASAAQTKVYGDADPVFTYTFAPALIGADVFTGNISRSAGESIGSYPFTLGTLSAGTNYNLSIAATPEFSITAKTLTITGLTADNKPYDGTTAATLSGTAALSGVVSPDAVILGGTPVATFAAPDVADGVAVTVTGYTISGVDAGNYLLTQPTGLTANITVATAVENIYGGNLAFTLYPNPATDVITLNVTNSENRNLSYVLFDSRGNILESEKLTSSKTTIQLQNRLAGTYFIKISDNKNVVKTIKFIKN